MTLPPRLFKLILKICSRAEDHTTREEICGRKDHTTVFALSGVNDVATSQEFFVESLRIHLKGLESSSLSRLSRSYHSSLLAPYLSILLHSSE